MSQFRVEKVTKVKGLSDLSEKAKVAEKEPTTKRTRGTANIHERPPSTQGRQTSVKKTSLPSKAGTSSEASSSQSKGKPSVPQRSGAPKPAARTKPSTQNPKATANKVPAAKNCPSQQDRQSSATTTDAPATKKKSSGYGVTPAQRTRTSAVSKPSLQKAPRETNTNLKKKSEIKKENSYDASDSDSEKGSVDRLTTDGDFGYETGSYDDSDVSTGELLSPSAKDEQKSILNPNPGGSTTYSYAAVEGRPLLVTDEGGISSSIGNRELPTKGDRSSYTYAGDEFRPLIITEEGGVAGPVKGVKTPMSGGSDRAIGGGGFDSKDKPSPQRRVQVPMAYEEVEVFEGGYDRSNIKLTPSANERTNENSSVVPANDVYAVVQKKPKEISTAESTNNVLEDSRNEASTSDQLYATVQKPPSQPQRPNVELAEIPPSIPGTRKDSNMYEAITGELQNMIMACDEVPMDGKSSEADSNERKTSDGDKKVPPPMPKPYAGPGLSYVEQKEHLAENYLSDSEKEEDTEANLQPVYAIVQKKPKDKPVENKPTEENIHKPANDISTSAESLDEESQPVYAAVKKPAKPVYHRSLDSLDQLRIPITLGDDDDEDDEGDMPPPLPARPTDLGDTMKKTHSSEDVLKIKQTEEKPKKGGFNIFKKKHRRQLSDGNVASQIKTAVENGNLSSSATKGNGHGHRRSKSQADAADFIPAHRKIADSKDSYAEITIPPSKVRSPSDETPPVKPYLEVDIQTEPPSTPTELKKERRFMGGGTIGQSAPYELPDGWREVKSDSGTYYWHVASGTTQWDPPQVAPRLKKKLSDEGKPSPEITERQKVLSFPVHSMGWIELEESQVAPHNMSETISECISTLAQKRNDLWNTSETWGEGKDIRLLLEGDTLKLTEPRTKVTMLVQPVSKMRVWGVGKEDHRDFAYVARDPSTGKHKCHMFRCHGNISGRAITSALHEMCSKILEEKKKAQEIVKKTSPQKPWSDILNTPPPPSARDHASFNEKPHVESKKSFSAKYIGSIEVSKPTGVDTLNKAINKLTSKGGTWRTILIEISVSNIRITDCSTQELLSEDRVRFMSFFGVGKDERTCGYIVSTAPEVFVCHVFQCVPNAVTLTKALTEACQLRFQKCIDAHPEIISKVGTADLEKVKDKSDKDKDKAGFMTSVQGFLGKLGPKKGGGKKEEGSVQESKPVSSNHPVITCKPSHTFMVKYYGALPVAVGTGIETVEEAAKHLAGGTLLVCQLDVALNGVTLYDSQRSALSKRHFDADTISYCGLTSNRSHFGLIQSMGGGKYICHVFAEYKTKAGPIVAAIHETL